MILTKILRRAFLRLRSDYWLKDHRKSYEQLLSEARRRGYSLLGLEQFYDMANRGPLPPGFRCIALRHDVDISNRAGNRMFFDVERQFGANATYYFRLSTLSSHSSLIPQLLADGAEVGYHFEEAATLAKERRLRSRDAVFRHRAEIEDMFRRNCLRFRDRWNPALRSVAAHGDWINRKLRFTNNELLSDELLASSGLAFEAYQDRIKRRFDIYFSDVATPPENWATAYPFTGSAQGPWPLIYTLTHERRWHVSPAANTAENLRRIWQTLVYHSRA